tara:strand:+ start:1333 stop:2145 length:813 start_codon:yes stop_codon:yes gene_type:complete
MWLKVKMQAINIIGIILFIYLIICFVIYLMQDKLLYHPGENNYLDQNSLNHEIEKIHIPSDEKLIAWHYKKNKDFKTLLFFHGNAGKIDNRIYKLNEFSKMDLNYLIFAYRGFSGNSGKPHEAGFYKDAKAAKLWLNLNNVPDNQIILYGESLGTAVAIEAAKENDFAGVILESPFTSMTELAKKYYPYLPVKILLRDKYDTIKKLKLVNSPILVMHGKRDKIVPYEMGLKVYEVAKSQKFKFFNDYDDHMMDFNEDLVNSINNFVKNLN